MSTFLHRVTVLMKSILAVAFFTIFFCVTFLFRKTPAHYSRIRNEQVILLRQLKQKVSEWRTYTRDEVKSNQAVVSPYNCLLKTDVQQKQKPSSKQDAVDSKKSKPKDLKEPKDQQKDQKTLKRETKKEKKRKEPKKEKPIVSTKIHTLIISDEDGKTLEEVHFMDEDYQEVLEYMRSKKKKDVNGGVSKLPT